MKALIEIILMSITTIPKWIYIKNNGLISSIMTRIAKSNRKTLIH